MDRRFCESDCSVVDKLRCCQCVCKVRVMERMRSIQSIVTSTPSSNLQYTSISIIQQLICVPTQPIFLLPTSWDWIDNGFYKTIRYPSFHLIIPLYIPTTLIRYATDTIEQRNDRYRAPLSISYCLLLCASAPQYLFHPNNHPNKHALFIRIYN